MLSLLDSNNKVTKKFWKYIKSMLKDTTSINILHFNGEDYTNSETKANILNNQFTSVFTKTTECLFLVSLVNLFQIYLRFQLRLMVSITYWPTLMHIRQLAMDQMTYLLDFKRICSTNFSSTNFNFAVLQKLNSHNWKIANISPIHKKNNRADPTNYRPISLTSICCKTLEHIIYLSIFFHLEKPNLLSDNQHGFRAKRLCETQLLGAINDFQLCLNRGGHIDASFLDFTKAFDKVCHSKLCHKLSIVTV